ncbi:hypothetical protein KUV80_12975 [Fictibacillus nanhaiensis]|uniref:hypothetical protein n=1 Tax=Fictibacillus nanhaiensis TaxID=742169 RepID=UPI001C97BBBC|nr:hypothetical protein [Fictibacillus nanhaiensis]MBY6037576.1 hypothetical protein [Fictibacillus nanhaiensis]
MRQGNRWKSVADELEKSLYGEQIVCSMSTELYHIPKTKKLEGNNNMHRFLVPASYHRVTAVGSAIRMVNGYITPSVLKTLILCIQQAEDQDKGVRKNLKVMLKAAPEPYKPFVENIIQWQDYAELHLQHAKQLTMQMTGSSSWQDSSSN